MSLGETHADPTRPPSTPTAPGVSPKTAAPSTPAVQLVWTVDTYNNTLPAPEHLVSGWLAGLLQLGHGYPRTLHPADARRPEGHVPYVYGVCPTAEARPRLALLRGLVPDVAARPAPGPVPDGACPTINLMDLDARLGTTRTEYTLGDKRLELHFWHEKKDAHPMDTVLVLLRDADGQLLDLWVPPPPLEDESHALPTTCTVSADLHGGETLQVQLDCRGITRWTCDFAATVRYRVRPARTKLVAQATRQRSRRGGCAE
jgi:hypothetical protein